MKTIIIVQARMTSTRLPGKVLKAVMGRPLLEYQLQRLRRVRQADDLLVATTSNATDDPVVDLCQGLSVKTFRGSEADVLSRYQGCAEREKAGVIVRITADCPLIDPEVIDQIISCYHDQCSDKNSVSDFVSNTLVRTFPQGLDTEVFSFATLSRLFHEFHTPFDREHVTGPVYNPANGFKTVNFSCACGDFSEHRWTVDTREDFELIRRIIESLYPHKPDFVMQDVLDVLSENPEWVGINADSKQMYGP